MHSSRHAQAGGKRLPSSLLPPSPHLEQGQVVVQHASGRLLDAHLVGRIALAGAGDCGQVWGALCSMLRTGWGKRFPGAGQVQPGQTLAAVLGIASCPSRPHRQLLPATPPASHHSLGSQ